MARFKIPKKQAVSISDIDGTFIYDSKDVLVPTFKRDIYKIDADFFKILDTSYICKVNLVNDLYELKTFVNKNSNILICNSIFYHRKKPVVDSEGYKYTEVIVNNLIPDNHAFLIHDSKNLGKLIIRENGETGILVVNEPKMNVMFVN